ncbi:hypothetical protein RhiJN_02483 [Ceratobasidium sp. AG-Ba]|nr:hypothetical protein RhiJN_02483 [Ceratobasidium sp. AG-Ba]QRW03411.1 hypothetical protein RhiLY_02410 [Ceratobasidium sp. AG-Ba]
MTTLSAPTPRLGRPGPISDHRQQALYPSPPVGQPSCVAMASSVIGTSIDDADGTLSGFQYFGGWGLGESIPEHYDKTAHYSNSPGSQAVLYFRGTTVLYYADRAPTLSMAAVSIDGLPPDQVNLTSPTPQYQQPVWSKNVTDGDHQLVIQHAGAPQTNIMVDYVTILSNGSPVSQEAGLAAASVNVSAQFIDDTSPQVQYAGSGWRFVSQGLFYNQSSQITQSRGASFQLTFNGTQVWYFTDTGPDHGNVLIRIDDSEDGQTATGYSPRPLGQQLIWAKTDLSPGTHTINITHADTDGKYMTLDFFRFTPSEGTPPSSGRKLNKTGAIAGGVIAGLFGLGIIYCIFVTWALPRFRRRGQADETGAPVSQEAGNRPSSRSSMSTSPYYPYVDRPESDHEPMGGTIPMSYVVPSTQIGRYPVAFKRESTMSVGGDVGEDGGPTPAQVYRDSIRASFLGPSGSVTDSGVETTPQMRLTGPDNNLNLIAEAEEGSFRSSPPSYKQP